MINPYAIIGAIISTLVLLTGIALGGVHVGKMLEREVWLDKQDVSNKAFMKEKDRLIAKNESDRQEYILKTKQASDDHAKEIEAINVKHAAFIGQRVRVADNFLHTVKPAHPAGKSAGAGNAGQTAPPAQFLPDAFASDLRQLAADADAAIADLRQLETSAKAAKCFEGYE